MKDNILLAQLEDASLIGQKRLHFIGFLTETELAEAEDYLAFKKEKNVLFWGGYENAKRKFVAMFPDYIESEEIDFPIQPITFIFSKSSTLSHSDFLGLFMSLGVERSAIGDILVEEGRCVAFLRKEIWVYFQANIEKIGNVPVKMQEGFQGSLPVTDRFEELNGVVASARLDCMVAFLARQSREKAANLVKSGYVSVNHREVSVGTKMLKEGDVVSIRKNGRFLVESLGPNTAKGRLRIHCRQYK